ncbi:unnamed protein product [Leptidea sinapis]|uniref:Kazal-like domain-containing protein n=1 Tax=Leptidea sinapis TaxID=189913 RepID=A0A5E4QPZ2_9NEOP|nr:unnamed protein product [Leptidea sinapis]
MKFIWLITVIVAVFFWPLATAEKDCYKNCSLVLKPVCATNGNTYSSLCFLKCDGATFAHNGNC